MGGKKLLLYVLSFILLTTFVFAAQQVSYNGKQYFVVTSTDPTEDTGAEVCGKAGMVCVGYTEPTNAVCKLVHPTAGTSASTSGDRSGVYCNGAPQNGVCSSKSDICHTCPQCTVSVDCNTPIGGLYREMYAECAPASSSASCKVTITSTTTQQLLNEIPSLNAQLQSCPQPVPAGFRALVGSGNFVLNVQMRSGNTQSITVNIANRQITGVSLGSNSCTQAASVSENDLDTALSSTSPGQAAAFLLGQKKLQITGCTFISRVKLFFVNPVARVVARRQAPAPPPPAPAPNCGNVGEQCNNRGCFSGMCAAPRERNSNGQWGHWNYRCIDQAQYTANCIGRGNSPPAWACLTGICR